MGKARQFKHSVPIHTELYTYDRLPRRMCSVSRDLLSYCEMHVTHKRYKIETQLQQKTDRKSNACGLLNGVNTSNNELR